MMLDGSTDDMLRTVLFYQFLNFSSGVFIDLGIIYGTNDIFNVLLKG